MKNMECVLSLGPWRMQLHTRIDWSMVMKERKTQFMGKNKSTLLLKILPAGMTVEPQTFLGSR